VPFFTGALATLGADVEGGGIERSQEQRRLPVVVMEEQKDGGARVSLRFSVKTLSGRRRLSQPVTPMFRRVSSSGDNRTVG
jgi:hypothetical protein